MKRIRDFEPKGNLPKTDPLFDLDYHTHSKIRWLDAWLEKNLTEEQKEKLELDYEKALND